MILAPTVPPLLACQAYLEIKLAEHSTALPVGVEPPNGTPHRYALITSFGSSRRSELTRDYLMGVKVFDADVVQCEINANHLHAFLLGATHSKVTTALGDLWISGTEHQSGPSDIRDPDVPLFGREMSVFWTVAVKPLTP